MSGKNVFMEEAIPVLRVSDASSAVNWFARLGYVQEWEHTFKPGMPVFMSIARNGAARIFLSEHTGDASPDTLVHLRVEEIDAVAHEFGVDVLDKPWGREVHLVDPDGNRLRVGVTATS
jgi:hypothetical protein